ncbi:hypothetical protein [Sphingomonas sp. SRS2]|uniref:hypothetical protein n=1 Tax=Sphingomonas sp. SRS2 TaxID=133190 RepID=UPI000AEE0AE3|nr:hypothetical protein [Sphingomonas sp. SRS2]
MKAAWAVGAAALVSVPIMALPTKWSVDPDPGIARYTVGDLGNRGSYMIIACPDGQGADISVAVNGVIAPSDSQIGFRAANRTFVMKSNGNGLIETKSKGNAGAFVQLWQAIRAGKTLDVSFTNGVSASLSLAGSARALPASPCPVDYRPGKLNL